MEKCARKSGLLSGFQAYHRTRREQRGGYLDLNKIVKVVAVANAEDKNYREELFNHHLH